MTCFKSDIYSTQEKDALHHVFWFLEENNGGDRMSPCSQRLLAWREHGASLLSGAASPAPHTATGMWGERRASKAQNTEAEARLPGPKARPQHRGDASSRTSRLTPLCLSVLICKMRVIILPASGVLMMIKVVWSVWSAPRSCLYTERASQVVLGPAGQCRGHKRCRSDAWEGPLEEAMAAHPSVLAWRIPWAEGPGEEIQLSNWACVHVYEVERGWRWLLRNQWTNGWVNGSYIRFHAVSSYWCKKKHDYLAKSASILMRVKAHEESLSFELVTRGLSRHLTRHSHGSETTTRAPLVLLPSRGFKGCFLRFVVTSDGFCVRLTDGLSESLRISAFISST